LQENSAAENGWREKQLQEETVPARLRIPISFSILATVSLYGMSRQSPSPTYSPTEVSMDQQLPVSQPNAEPMSVKDWIITLLITYIPLVGLIMLLVWAFDSSTHPNKKNFAKAALVWMLIGIVLALIFFALFASMMMGVVGTME
jgi:hypothetical protein